MPGAKFTIEQGALRLGEAVSLTWGDVDRAGLRLRLPRSATKRDQARWVYLPEWLIEALHARMREATGEGSARERLIALVDVIFTSPERNRAFFAVYLDFCSLAHYKIAPCLDWV